MWGGRCGRWGGGVGGVEGWGGRGWGARLAWGVIVSRKSVGVGCEEVGVVPLAWQLIVSASLPFL